MPRRPVRRALPVQRRATPPDALIPETESVIPEKPTMRNDDSLPDETRLFFLDGLEGIPG